MGINTLIYTGANDDTNEASGIGINLATPSNVVTTVMKDLIEYGGSSAAGWAWKSIYFGF